MCLITQINDLDVNFSFGVYTLNRVKNTWGVLIFFVVSRDREKGREMILTRFFFYTRSSHFYYVVAFNEKKETFFSSLRFFASFVGFFLYFIHGYTKKICT